MRFMLKNKRVKIKTGKQDKTMFFFSVNNMAERSHAKAGLNALYVT